MNYILTIIIPTKNRFKYCVSAIKSCLNINNELIQVVVQDNSDVSNKKIFCDLFSGYSNVKYNYTQGILSFVDNFSYAISLADGEYVCMIGDDDGILPNILETVRNMKEEQADALVPGLNSVYIWPSNTPFIKGAENGYLCVANIKKKMTNINPMKGLQKLLKNGGQYYQDCDIPRLYHGIVKRNKLDEVKKITGNYFYGLTPDIYSAVALSYVCNKVLRIGYPITVSGICPNSGSADSATGKHTGKLSDAPHFRGHKDYQWDEKIPTIYTVESIWAETVLTALLDFDDKKSYDEFNILYLNSLCLKKYPQFKKEIYDHSKKYGINKIKLIFTSNYIIAKLFIIKVIKRIFRNNKRIKKLFNVNDIFDAIDITMNYMR